MVDLSPYEGIVFDMDGTLIDSMPGHMEAWKVTCERYGYPFDAHYMNSLGGVPTWQTVIVLNNKFGMQNDPTEVARFKRETWESMELEPVLIASTMAVFEHYRPTMAIGIGTGAERLQAEHLLAAKGLLNRIDTLVTATDVSRGKPHPETFLTVAQQMGIEPAKCVVFEDTAIGKQAAAAAGMDCIMVKNGEIQI
ncbi:beta-phosphoglucomutase family hydrolase [Alteromonas lipolytica]|uniref:Carotenoid dehydrogenase n=1 Tax=Alteromonas lipolytica TaxID=1856405 RepID=A0A1E8FJQ5_9ALTE|nr:beta-phosphoglucomutase family hydrolase [Alteromonas lipolytica]OFI36171.1 carotenoid dehydrogenase [Alteromonas lipolytica]GGF78364.1 carotenoid dehydrogenase [Alteromonas lipolytica]